MNKIPKEFLKSNYRKEMWKNALSIIRKIERVIPFESAYLRGSFTTNKKRPADVDFIILIKVKANKKAKWSVDFVICPDNKYGDFVVKDATKWMKQKFGSKKAMFIKIK